MNKKKKTPVANAEVKESNFSSRKEIFNEIYTVGDYLADGHEDWLDESIRSGELFKVSIYNLTKLMDQTNRSKLYEKIDSLTVSVP